MSDAAPTPETKAEEKTTTPIFGSGSTFGAGSGFAGFTGTPAATADTSGADAEGGDDEAATEEECQAEFKPIVQLEEVETSTGEEEEDNLLELKCKLYRFDTANSEWKERGIGFVKILQHKENKKVRLLMRQEKTLKIRANHIIMPGTKLQEHSGSDKSWVWSTVDFAEGEQKVELFCIRFGTAERANDFKTKFEAAGDTNAELIGTSAVAESEDTEAVDSVTEAVEKVKVADT